MYVCPAVNIPQRWICPSANHNKSSVCDTVQPAVRSNLVGDSYLRALSAADQTVGTNLKT